MAIYKLRDICNIKNGTTPSTLIKSYWNGTIPFLQPNDLLSNNVSRFINEDLKLWKREGSTLLSTVATIGNIKFLHNKSWFNQHITSFEPDNGVLVDKYLYYFLISIKKIITKMPSSGSTFQTLTIDNFKNLYLDIPSIEIQQQIIDIIEPIELLETQINNLNWSLLKFIKNIPTNNETFYLNSCVKPIKNPPKKIKQLSAKVLNKRNPLINSFEAIDTYKTNSFYCPPKTLIINSIRTYLEKFTILCDDADVNGTMFQLEVKNNFTSIINNLLNDNFWDQTNQLSKGTKMPQLSKDDLLNKITFKQTNIEIDNLFEQIIILNKLLIKTKIVQTKLINLLFKI